MKQLLFIFIVLTTMASCQRITGSGNIVTEKRQTGDFKGVSAGGSFEVEVKTGTATEVVVEADDNVMPYIKTEVNGDVLRISTKNNININNAHLKVFVTAPEITSLKSSGASDIKIKDGIKSERKISLDVSGAGNISGGVDAPEVYAEVSGAGGIQVSGRTRDYTARVSGSGNLKTSDLQTENTDVDVSGAGNAWVHASVKLKADASGAGNIHFKGGAQIQQHTSGAGSITSQN